MSDIATALLQMNGAERPEIGREKGSPFDYAAGDLVFSSIPGVGPDAGLLYDYRVPTVLQLREMLDRDGKARSLEQALVMPIVGTDWHLEGGDQEIEDWIEDIFRRATLNGGMDTPMVDVIAQKAEAFIMRRSYHEKVWKLTDDNKYVYQKIAWRPPDTCTLIRHKRNGNLEGFAQQVVGEAEQVPIKLPYADVYVHGAQRDPNKGISDLTVTYHNYRIKEKLKFLWYTYCEVLSLPRQIVMATSEQGGKKAAQAIAALKNAGVAGIPAEWVKEIKEISVAGSGATDFQDAIGYLDSDSAQSLLAGFVDLPGRAMGAGTSHGPVGSYALAESSTNFFTGMMKSYAQEMASQITNSLVADLVRYNYGFKIVIPHMVLDLQQEKIAQAFAMLERIITSPVPQNVPPAFVRELVLAVAKQLGMDVKVIERAIRQQAEQLAAQGKPNAELQAAANVGSVVSTQAQQEGTT